MDFVKVYGIVDPKTKKWAYVPHKGGRAYDFYSTQALAGYALDEAPKGAYVAEVRIPVGPVV